MKIIHVLINKLDITQNQTKWECESVNEKREVVSSFVEGIMNQFRSVLPDLWKLWIQYSTGTLLHNDPAQANKLKQLSSLHTKEIKVKIF